MFSIVQYSYILVGEEADEFEREKEEIEQRIRENSDGYAGVPGERA